MSQDTDSVIAKPISQLPEYTGSPDQFTIPGIDQGTTKKANLGTLITKAITADTTKASASQLSALTQQVSSKANQSEVTQLSLKVSKMVTLAHTEISDLWIADNLTSVEERSNNKLSYIKVDEGEKIIISATSTADSTRHIRVGFSASLPASGVAITNGEKVNAEPSQTATKEFTAPSEGYVVATRYYSQFGAFTFKKDTSAFDEIDSLTERIEDVEEEVAAPVDAKDVYVDDEAIRSTKVSYRTFNEPTSSGASSVIEGSSNRNVIHYAEVSNADKLKISTHNDTASRRFYYVGFSAQIPNVGVALTNTIKEYVDANADSEIEVTAPSDGYVVIYGYSSQFASFTIEDDVFLDEKINEIDGKLATIPTIVKNKGLEIVPNNTTHAINSGDSIDSISLWADRLQRGTAIEFYAKIDTFGTLKIGAGVGNGERDYFKEWYEIGATNIVLKKCQSTSGTISTEWTKAHGLTLTNFIAINIKKTDFGKAKIFVMTEGGDWSFEDTSGWNGHHAPCVVSDGCVLHDCKLSINNSYISKDMWLFGSSYHGNNSTRIVGQLLNLGYGDWLQDSRPGATISESLADFKKLLNYGVPKIIHVGTFGNGSSDSDFEAAFNEFVSICEEYGIEAVYSVQPDRLAKSLSARRDIVINSGVRYVDYNTPIRVSDYPNTAWISGYMSSDGIHMTELGAKAFAHIFLRDMPEALAYPTIATSSEEETTDPTE